MTFVILFEIDFRRDLFIFVIYCKIIVDGIHFVDETYDKQKKPTNACVTFNNRTKVSKKEKHFTQTMENIKTTIDREYERYRTDSIIHLSDSNYESRK